jgi:glucosamine-6-phosphate deaminase
MRIISAKNYEEMGKMAANVIAAQMKLKPDSVLGLATGSSPISTYENLIQQCQAGELDFSRAKSVNLDEYVGLDAANVNSYRYFMQQHLFDHININPANTHVPCGTNPDTEGECAAYDELIRKLGGIDLQLLGLGPNGHIGFNEPSDCFIPGTHKVKLADATIQANSRMFEQESDVPHYAYTMGIRDIVQAKCVLMIVSGENKAEILKKAFYGKITPQVPASILQLHPNFILVADEAALRLC